MTVEPVTLVIKKNKRKPLIFEANLCPDRQWDDYKESVCPLLEEFGCFDDT